MRIVGVNWSGSIDPQFKLAVVLGPSRVAGKSRVRVWLHAPRRFSNPTAVDNGKLYPVEQLNLGPRHKTVLRAAREAARNL